MRFDLMTAVYVFLFLGTLNSLCGYLLVRFLITGESKSLYSRMVKRSENPIQYWCDVLEMLFMAFVSLGFLSMAVSSYFGMPDVFEAVLDWFGLG
jgi:hypothetical protein